MTSNSSPSPPTSRGAVGIRGRLFLGMATLALTLLAAQWWLQRLQLQAIEAELSQVATEVGRFIYQDVGETTQGVWVSATSAEDGRQHKVERKVVLRHLDGHEPDVEQLEDIEVDTTVDFFPKEDLGTEGLEVDEGLTEAQAASDPDQRKKIRVEHEVLRLPSGVDTKQDVRLRVASAPAKPKSDEIQAGSMAWSPSDQRIDPGDEGHTELYLHPDDLEIKVELLAEGGRHLVIHGGPGGERRLSLGDDPTHQAVQRRLDEGLQASAALLLLGLLGAGLFAHHLTRPLDELVEASQALGGGALGHQIPEDAPGELGELQRAFNRMSTQLAELEAEKARWQARSHLAELGDIARGLGHTLRNPLHTLGLTVEALAAQSPSDAEDLVLTARGQIRRIDRWLRSFLAVGAGQEAQPEPLDLGNLLADLALEAGPPGVDYLPPESPLMAQAVAPALRAALSNLITNGLEASPPDAPVALSASREDEHLLILIEDRGAGLPDEVRAHLFSPHITTKGSGSGMGLYLSKQIIEGGHGGTLNLEDRAGGGTRVIIRLPVDPPPSTQRSA